MGHFKTILLGLLSSLLFSCSEEPDLEKTGKTAIFVYMAADNDLDYFAIQNINLERIDTVALDDKIVCTDIDVNTTVVCEERITNSIHKLICYTHSNLKLIVEFKAISKTEQIMATIHNDGSVSLR